MTIVFMTMVTLLMTLIPLFMTVILLFMTVIPLFMTIVSLTGACLFRVVWIYTIFQHFHRLETLYISYPISWTLTFSVHLICFLILYRKLGKRWQETASFA